MYPYIFLSIPCLRISFNEHCLKFMLKHVDWSNFLREKSLRLCYDFVFLASSCRWTCFPKVIPSYPLERWRSSGFITFPCWRRQVFPAGRLDRQHTSHNEMQIGTTMARKLSPSVSMKNRLSVSILRNRLLALLSGESANISIKKRVSLKRNKLRSLQENQIAQLSLRHCLKRTPILCATVKPNLQGMRRRKSTLWLL